MTFPAVVHGTVQLVAYSGTNATTPIISSAKSAANVTANSYTTPGANVPAAGDVVISYWAAKSSAVTAWTVPASQTVRSTANGSGGGRVNSVATDGGSAPAGASPGLTANTDQSGGAFAAWTIVVGP